jgi:arylsulfatase A-like enzyme
MRFLEVYAAFLAPTTILFSNFFQTIYAKPNIIVMQPDDLQFYDDWSPPPNNPIAPSEMNPIPRSSDGNVLLPNMEFLRTNGLQMKQAYTVSPMCGTSRYSTITGKYPSRAASSRKINSDINLEGGVGRVIIPYTKLHDEPGQNNDCTEENLAVTFQNQGYRTGMIGKWHLTGFDDTAYTYANSQETVRGCGFDTVEALFMENLKSEGGFNTYSDGTFSHNMEWVTVEAVNFINDASSSNQPFFLYFNPTVPHGSNDVRTALTEFSCKNVANGTLESDPVIEGMTAEYSDGCIGYRQSVFNRATFDNELGPIWVDDSIGALLKALEKNKILNETIFLFQNDHGMETKAAILENGNRIAQFIHYPDGIISGTSLDVPVATIDIGPTLLDFAGIDPPYSMDGISWKDAMSDSAFESYLKTERCLFFEIQMDRAVRCGCSKYLQINGVRSITYSRGNRLGYTVADNNVFDLCGGTDEYVTKPTTNMEGTNLYSVDTEKDLILADLMSCHLARTNFASDPDYSACALSTLSPAATPTDAPVETVSAAPSTSTCTDSADRFRLTWNNKKITRDCIWVANKATLSRCKAGGVSAICPKACGLCPPCVDSTDRFRLTWNNKTITRDCIWVANKATLSRCKVEGVSNICRSTCGTC